ncbi:MAG: hypothetical protein JOZ57_11440 [Abitibacteriaceae bacterium]|nr:hypothetical protein [Abditibacteriaceae bacterium]
MPQKDAESQDDDGTMVGHIGPVEIDWAKTIGFYGGLSAAVAFELVAPPLAIFIGIYPLLKLLNRPKAPLPVRILSDLLEGAAKPVGGDAEGTIRVTSPESPIPGIGPNVGSPQAAKGKHLAKPQRAVSTNAKAITKRHTKATRPST